MKRYRMIKRYRMMFKFLPAQNYLSKGSSLWIVPDTHSSQIAKEIDWYLSFIYTKTKKNSDLLVESSLMIPNRHTLFIELSKDPVVWLERAHMHWSKMVKPSLRLFLPPSVSTKMLVDFWKLEPLPYKISIVNLGK